MENLTSLGKAFMTVALSHRHYSKCVKRKVVVMAVKNDVVLGWAVNHGNGEDCICVPIEGVRHPHVKHAESVLCETYGEQLEGADIYLSYSPCDTCAKLLVKHKVRKVVYYEYSDYPEGIKILKSQNITVIGYGS